MNIRSSLPHASFQECIYIKQVRSLGDGWSQCCLFTLVADGPLGRELGWNSDDSCSIPTRVKAYSILEMRYCGKSKRPYCMYEDLQLNYYQTRRASQPKNGASLLYNNIHNTMISPQGVCNCALQYNNNTFNQNSTMEQLNKT